jgi:GNAT superfamily N-acetyltransferase
MTAQPMSIPETEIVIRTVSLETRELFAAILEEASARQRMLGSEGWDYPFDDTWMLPRIARGELFLAFSGAEPVAAFRILWEDRPFWGDREIGDSVYLHTFAVRHAKAGLGIGDAIIEQVGGMGRERGRAKLRLDCALSSKRLIAYYERNGFASVGTTVMKGRLMNLMERPL